MEAQTTSTQRPGGGGGGGASASASNGRRRRGAAAGGGTHTCPHCGRTFKRSEHKERHVRTRQFYPGFSFHFVNLPQIPESCHDYDTTRQQISLVPFAFVPQWE